MIQEVVATVMSASSMSASSLSVGGGTIKVSKSSILAGLETTGVTTITSDLALNSLLVQTDAVVNGTLDAGDTVIIGQTAAQRADLSVIAAPSATLQLGPMWRIVSTDSSIDVHYALDFVNFVRVATLVQLEP